MADYRGLYCRHCRKHTLFFMESDLLWYCDECGNVYDSIPADEMDDEAYGDYEIGEIIRCPLCNNLIETDELVDGCLCPVCFEDLSKELRDYNEE